MALDFESLLAQWESFGVFNILLPFLLMFAITFAILEKIELFGKKRQINAIISAILGIILVRNQYVVGIINRFLPNVALFMIVILMFLLLVGVFMGKHEDWSKDWFNYAVGISLIFVVWALSSDFVGSIFEIPDWLHGFDDQTKATVIFIGIFVAVIWYVVKGGTSSSERGQTGGIDLSRLGGSSN